jgi:hypothetical protein
MTKYICLSCNKEATPTTNHDPNSAIVYYFAECCLDKGYAQPVDK